MPDLIFGAPLLPVVDWRATSLLIIVGENPIVSHGHGMAIPNPIVALRSIHDRHGSVIVVDPRRTETASAADVHLQIRPGTDSALIAFLVKAALGRPDEHYLRTYIDQDSLRRLRDAVEPFDRDYVARLCDIDGRNLDRVCALVDTTERLAFICGTGVSMGPTPNAAEWLAWALAGVKGSIDRRGGMLFNPGVLRPQEGGLRQRDRRSGPSPKSRPELEHLYGEYPCVAMADEIEAGHLRALFVLGGNPAITFPDSARTAAALSRLELLVVCDVKETETTRLATVVLPMADLLERADITSGLEAYYPVPFAQFTRRVVAPSHESRPMSQVFTELQHRYEGRSFAVPSDELEILRATVGRSRVAWDDLIDAPSGIAVDSAPSPGWLVPTLLPRGSIDVAPEELVNELHAWRARTFFDDDARDTRLILVNRRLPRQMNTVLTDNDQVARGPFATLLMNPMDATQRSLEPGQSVEVRSEHGSAVAVLEIDGNIRKGVVSIPHGWNSPNVNKLTSTSDGVDRLTGMPRLSSIRVIVRPTD